MELHHVLEVVPGYPVVVVVVVLLLPVQIPLGPEVHEQLPDVEIGIYFRFVLVLQSRAEWLGGLDQLMIGQSDDFPKKSDLILSFCKYNLVFSSRATFLEKNTKSFKIYYLMSVFGLGPSTKMKAPK